MSLAKRENVRVVVRFRPTNKIEISKENNPECKISPHDKLEYDTINNNILLGKKKTKKQWGFDTILGPSVSQKETFQLVAEQTCKDVVNGYNGTIFVYGQTGSGKTYTMYGPEGGHGTGQLGLIPRAGTYIFNALRNDEQIETYRLTCSFLEIYQEKSRDLLNKSKKQDLKIRLNKRHETIMKGLVEHEVSSVEDIGKLIAIAISNRVSAATNMNATSSRSHMLMRLQLVTKLKSGAIRIGSCNFADLAGSEKVKKTNATGTRLDEAKAINKSLTILGQVILALSKQSKHVPFRDSTLTHILRDSLGGNCKTTLIVAVSPHVFNRTETINALRFGRRCKLIQNKASVNRVFSNDELMKRLAVLETQNAKLEEILKKKAFEKFKNSELPKQIEALKKEIEKLKAKIKELETENEALGKRMQTLQRKNMELEDKQTVDIHKINELNKEIETLNNEIYSLKNRSLKTQQDRDAMSSQSQTLMDKLSRIETEKNELLKNVNKLNIEMEYLNQQKLESQKEKIEMIKKMQNDRNEMEAIIKEKESLLKDNEKEIKKLRLENENNLKLLSAKNKLLEEMEKIRDQNTEWLHLNAVLNGEKDTLNKLILTSKETNNKLNDELNQFKQELSALNQEKMSMKEAQLKLQNENNKLSDDNKEMEELLKSEREKFNQNLNQKDRENNGKQQEMRDKFRLDLQKQKDELSANHAELIKLKEKQLRAEYDALLQNAADEYKQNMETQTLEWNKKYEQDLKQLKEELLANYTEELNQFKKELNALNQEKMAMKEAQLKLQNENKKLSDENKEIEQLLGEERGKFETNANQKDIDINKRQQEMRDKFKADLQKQQDELKANHAEFIKLKEEQLRSEYDAVLKQKQQEYEQNMNDKIAELNKEFEEKVRQMKEALLANYTQELNQFKKELNDLNQEKDAMEESNLKLQDENNKLMTSNTEMEEVLKSERNKFDQSLSQKDAENANKLEEMRLKSKMDLQRQQDELKANHSEFIKLKEEQLRTEFDAILKSKEEEFKQNMSGREDEFNKKYEQDLEKLKLELLANYNEEMRKKEEEFQLKYDELTLKYDSYVNERNDESMRKEDEFKRELNELTEEYNQKMSNSQNEFVEQLNKLQQSLNESHKRAKNLEIELSDGKMEINKLNESNDANIAKLQQMQHGMDILSAKNDECKQSLDKERALSKEKDDQLLRADNEIKSLEQSHDKYLFEIDELTRQLEEARLAQDQMREDFRRKEELFGAKQKETLNLLRQQEQKVNEYGELISEKDDLLQSKEWQLRAKEQELLLKQKREEQEKKERESMIFLLMQKSKSMREEDARKAKQREEKRRKLNEQRKTLLTFTNLPDSKTLKKMEKEQQNVLKEGTEEEISKMSFQDYISHEIETVQPSMTAESSVDMKQEQTTEIISPKSTEIEMKQSESRENVLKEDTESNPKVNEMKMIMAQSVSVEMKPQEMSVGFNAKEPSKDKEMSFKEWIISTGLKESTVDKLVSADIESLSELKEIENDLNDVCQELEIKVSQKIKLKKIIKHLPLKLPTKLPTVPYPSSPPVIANSVSIDDVITHKLSISEDKNEAKVSMFDEEKKKEFDGMSEFTEVANCEGIIIKSKFGRHKNAQKIVMSLVLFNGHNSAQEINSLSVDFDTNYSGLSTYIKDIKFTKQQNCIKYSDLYQFNFPLLMIADCAKKLSNAKNFNFMIRFVLNTNITPIKCNMNFMDGLHLYFNEKSKIETQTFLKQWKVKMPKEKIVSVNFDKVKYCNNMDRFKELIIEQNIFLIHHRSVPKKGHMLYCSCHVYSTDVLMEISIATPVKKGVVIVKSSNKFLSMLCANLIKSMAT